MNTTTLPPDSLPTKEELKRLCGITNDDFEIRVGPLPALTTQPPGAWAQKQDLNGKPITVLWLKPGLALMLSLAPAALCELTGCLDATVLLSGADHEPVVSINSEVRLVRYAVTTPAPDTIGRYLTPQEWDALPTYSTLRVVFENEAK